MEKVKIKNVQTKKGYDVELEFENGRRMKVPHDFEIPKDYDGAEGMVERKNGQIARIVLGENEYKKAEIQQIENSKTNETKEGSSMSYSSNSQSKARAPYNFVPLNEKVVDAESVLEFNRYHKDRYSGHIDFELETITPLYIRRESGSSEFFSIGGKVKIPGSSMRGMIRTIIEITSFSKFKFFNDNRLYYRGLADMSSLREHYYQKINDKKAGYLIFKENKYFIRPAVDFNSFEDISREFEHEYDKKTKTWKVWSGKVGNKKKKNWVILEPEPSADTEIELSEQDVEDYKNDKNRGTPEKFDIFEMAEKHKEKYSNGVPMFYAPYTDSQNYARIAVGHTGFFRLPYEHIISDHIPENLKKDDIIDIPEAIFGVENKFAGRVFFEDLDLMEGQNNIFLNETSPKILSSPKPTTFQHYLMQDESRVLKHWDNVDATIRGYKLYWHRNTPDDAKKPYSWNEGKIINDSQHTVIKPIGRNIKFSGRIRFENFSEVELGALLFAIELPDKCYHKLGMGKPLGLGSVKICNLSLYIIDRKKRYFSLFVEGKDAWNLAIERNNDTCKFKNFFNDYVLKRVTEEKERIENLWDTRRMKLLKHILNWENSENPEWLKKTSYMQIKPENEFRKRPILSEPDQFCNKEKSD